MQQPLDEGIEISLEWTFPCPPLLPSLCSMYSIEAMRTSVFQVSFLPPSRSDSLTRSPFLLSLPCSSHISRTWWHSLGYSLSLSLLFLDSSLLEYHNSIVPLLFSVCISLVFSSCLPFCCCVESQSWVHFLPGSFHFHPVCSNKKIVLLLVSSLLLLLLLGISHWKHH